MASTIQLRALQTRRYRRVTASDLGLHAVPLALLACQAGLLAVVLTGCRAVGIHPDGDAAAWISHVGPSAMLFAFWCAHYAQPGRKASEWWTAEAALGLAVLGLGTAILASGQYAAAAVNRPLVDPWLANADHRLGIDVPSLVEWTRRHARVGGVLKFAYHSLAPQLLLLVGAIWWTRDRHALWEYVVTYHICGAVTVLSSAISPAAGAFTYYGFTSTLDQARFIEHFDGLRAGTMNVVPLGNIEGLISMPSFHVIGALLLTWAVRRTRLVVPVAVLNAALIVSTVMTGAHYAVDVLGAFATWAAAVLIYQRYVARFVPQWMEGSPRQTS